MQESIKRYESEKQKIQSRLKEFQNISEESKFKQFLSCLLTPKPNPQDAGKQ